MTGRVARAMRRAAVFLAGLAVLALLAMLFGAVVPRPFGVAEGEFDDGPARRILVLANPIHTDIALRPDADVLARFAFLRDDGLPIDDPGVGWIVFGWGGRSFYLETPTWGDLKPVPVMRALTLDRAVMHVSVFGEIDPGWDGVLAVDLPQERFERLMERILAGFESTGQGGMDLVVGGAYGDYDLFYEARGRFNALVGCNVWTAATLRAAGLRTGWWNPLPQSLLWSLRRHNAPGGGQPGEAISSSGSQP